MNICRQLVIPVLRAGCVVVLLGLALAQGQGPGRPPQNKGETEKKDAALVALVARSNNAFAVDLYAKLLERPPVDGNVFFSPYSVSSSLGLTYSGARGTTAEQMAKGLQLSLTPQDLPGAFAALRKITTRKPANDKDGNYRLIHANALWGQKGLGFRPEFVQLAQNNFGAEVREVAFNADPEQARRTINAWVKDQTQDKFPELLPPGSLAGGTEVVLTNAVYFKANWSRPFNKKATEDAPFFVTPERSVRVPLMRQTGPGLYLREKDFRVLELPYVGDDVAMVILLPDRKDGLPAFEKTVTAANLTDWLARLKKQEVQLFLPRFKIAYDCELRERLSGMGLAAAFRPDADFSGMTGRKNFHLSTVMHKAYVSVNEEGTEAAAATTAAFIERGMENLALFRADHPFLFVIRDTRTNTILFWGRVVNPQ